MCVACLPQQLVAPHPRLAPLPARCALSHALHPPRCGAPLRTRLLGSLTLSLHLFSRYRPSFLFLTFFAAHLIFSSLIAHLFASRHGLGLRAAVGAARARAHVSRRGRYGRRGAEAATRVVRRRRRERGRKQQGDVVAIELGRLGGGAGGRAGQAAFAASAPAYDGESTAARERAPPGEEACRASGAPQIDEREAISFRVFAYSYMTYADVRAHPPNMTLCPTVIHASTVISLGFTLRDVPAPR